MRTDLIKTVQSITDLPQQQKIKPPVIPPKPSAAPVAMQPPKPAPLPTENDAALIMRVILEERTHGNSRLQLYLVNDKHNNLAPNVKLKPGMRVKIIVLPPLPHKNKNTGGGNAKK